MGRVHCYGGNDPPEGKWAGEGNDSAARQMPRGRWEEAVAANTPPADLEQLPHELRQRGREALQLLQGFARHET